jgi:DNA-binding transcriptional ArsR family regulator
MLVQVLTAIRLLRERPHRTEEIGDALGVPRRTVERLLAGIREAGLELETEVRGRERYHSLSRETLARVLP